MYFREGTHVRVKRLVDISIIKHKQQNVKLNLKKMKSTKIGHFLQNWTFDASHHVKTQDYVKRVHSVRKFFVRAEVFLPVCVVRISDFRVIRVFRDSDNKKCGTNFRVCATKRKLNEV